MKFSGVDNILGALARLGETPLPPYIERTAPEADDRERYQTVFVSGLVSIDQRDCIAALTKPDELSGGVRICFWVTLLYRDVRAVVNEAARRSCLGRMKSVK